MVRKQTPKEVLQEHFEIESFHRKINAETLNCIKFLETRRHNRILLFLTLILALSSIFLIIENVQNIYKKIIYSFLIIITFIINYYFYNENKNEIERLYAGYRENSKFIRKISNRYSKKMESAIQNEK